jgi:hypothetical protein
MSYVKITCKKCHHQYFTDKSLSRCPECNQLNSKDEGSILAFLVIAAICIAIATLLGGLFALLFYGFFWLFGMNRKWRAIVGVTLGVCIGLMTMYIIMFESGLNSEEVLPMIIIALLGGGSYYYLYKQVKNNPNYVDVSDKAKRGRRIVWGVLVLGALTGVAAYYISENNSKSVMPPVYEEHSQLNGGTEQYAADKDETPPTIEENRVEETSENASAASEMPAAAEESTLNAGMATVNVDRAYFYKDDKLTQRKSYLIRGELVNFNEGDRDFIYVSYSNAEGVVTKGWMRRSDFSDFSNLN